MKKMFKYILFFMMMSFLWASETNTNITSDGIAETYISGQTFQNKKVFYEIKDDLAIFEGDIVLGTVDQAERWRESNENYQGENSVIITGARYRWKNGVVPYQLASNVSSRTKKLIAKAIAHWQAKTPVRFVKRTSSNAKKYPDYVNVHSNQYACWSYVGKIGKKQDLNVVAACRFGGIVHEFGHALGLWHEQSREDRDKYIRVNWANIPSNRKRNFNQHITNGDDVGTYDYGSIMHYGRRAFSTNGKDTITPLKSGVVIGQRNGLSKGDIQSIKKMYSSFKNTNPCLTKAQLKAKIKKGEDVTKVNTSCITDMRSLFYGNHTFNQDISGWDVSNVTTMERMFAYALNFNQPIGSWNTSKVTDMSYMFANQVTNYRMVFNHPLDKWDTSNVTNMMYMFTGNDKFNQSLNNWNVSNVTNMQGMFSRTKMFNKPLNNWKFSKIKDVSFMFSSTSKFDQPLNKWDMSNAVKMNHMFYKSKSFNQPLSNWNTSNVTDMGVMFSRADAFNQPLNKWNVGNVTRMNYMFHDARQFNQNIKNWNVSKVKDHKLFAYGSKLEDKHNPFKSKSK